MKFEFDEIISAPCRLGILATLVPGQPVSFTEMKNVTSLSDGNLHVQTRKLAEVGYIEINKTRKGKRTVTQFSITELGRDRLKLHVAKLQQILDADTSTRPARAPRSALPAAPKDKRPAKQPAQRPDDSAVWA